MVSKTVSSLLVAVLIIGVSDVSSSGIGKCPQKTSMRNFNITNFIGEWFEVERSFYVMEMVASCTSVNFTPERYGNLNVVVSTVNRWTSNTSVKNGTAIPLVKGSSVLRYKPNSLLPYPLARLLPGAGIYYILYTDYDNYAIIWTCTNYAILHSDRFWILGRNRDFTASQRLEIYNKTKTFELDPERLINSKNYFCDDE